MTLARSVLELVASCLVYSIIIILVDFGIVFVLQRELSQVAYALSLVVLVEGGLALLVGGAAASFSPTFGKIGATVFRSEPWDAKRLREAERTARVWIATGLILLLLGLLVSAL